MKRNEPSAPEAALEPLRAAARRLVRANRRYDIAEAIPVARERWAALEQIDREVDEAWRELEEAAEGVWLEAIRAARAELEEAADDALVG